MTLDRDTYIPLIRAALATTEGAPSLAEACRTVGLNYATARKWLMARGEFADMVREHIPARLSHTPDAPSNVKLDEFIEKVRVAVPTQVHHYFPGFSSGDGDEQANLILSDLHVGRKTISFNAEVYRARCQLIVDRVIRLTEMYRMTGHALDVLNIFDLGDNLHGEYVGRQGRMQDFEFGVPEQLAWSVATQQSMYHQFADVFPEIHIWRIAGNHGDLDKMFSTGSNWDGMRGMLIEANMKNEMQFTFHSNADPNDLTYAIAEINGWRYCYTHGHDIKSSGGTPYSAILTKFQRWQGIESGKGKPFHVGLLGHFHHSFFVNQNRMRILMNGTIVTDDGYAKQLGYDATPQQWFFGSNSKRPMTFRFELDVDEREVA